MNFPQAFFNMGKKRHPAFPAGVFYWFVVAEQHIPHDTQFMHNCSVFFFCNFHYSFFYISHINS